MELFKAVALALLIVCVTACGGSPYDESIDPNDAPGVNNDAGGVSLLDFDVDGTSGGRIVGINSGIDDGAFSLSWDVDADDTYNAGLYLSEDDQLDTFFDTFVFIRFCGSGLSCEQEVDDYQCFFTTTNLIQCGESPNFDSETSISFFLDELPKDGYMILRVCNDDFSECEEQAVRVQLQ